MSLNISIRNKQDRFPVLQTPTKVSERIMRLPNDALRLKAYCDWVEQEMSNRPAAMRLHLRQLSLWVETNRGYCVEAG